METQRIACSRGLSRLCMTCKSPSSEHQGRFPNSTYRINSSKIVRKLLPDFSSISLKQKNSSRSIPEAISFPEEILEKSGSNSGSNFVSGGNARKARKQFRKHSGNNFVSGGNARKVRKQFRKQFRFRRKCLKSPEAFWKQFR